MKAKRVRKKNANTDNTETKVLSDPPLENKLEYTNNKRPSKPSLPHVLDPFKLLLPTDLTKPCLF